MDYQNFQTAKHGVKTFALSLTCKPNGTSKIQRSFCFAHHCLSHKIATTWKNRLKRTNSDTNLVSRGQILLWRPRVSNSNKNDMRARSLQSDPLLSLTADLLFQENCRQRLQLLNYIPILAPKSSVDECIYMFSDTRANCQTVLLGLASKHLSGRISSWKARPRFRISEILSEAVGEWALPENHRNWKSFPRRLNGKQYLF